MHDTWRIRYIYYKIYYIIEKTLKDFLSNEKRLPFEKRVFAKYQLKWEYFFKKIFQVKSPNNLKST